MKLSVESIFLDYAESLKFPLYHETIYSHLYIGREGLENYLK